MSFDVDYYFQNYGANWREDAPAVYAFQPRSRDAPHAVTEGGLNDLEEMVGSFVGAEQCDRCGNHSYRVEQRGPFRFVAVCATDPADDAEFAHPEPCGKEWAINLYREYEVVL